jgi:hypothetical protein
MGKKDPKLQMIQTMPNSASPFATFLSDTFHSPNLLPQMTALWQTGWKPLVGSPRHQIECN